MITAPKLHDIVIVIDPSLESQHGRDADWETRFYKFTNI